jgi:hypothetical protein
MEYSFPSIPEKKFQVLIQDDPSTKLSKGIYKNIVKSGLLWGATKTLVLPCPDVIEWMKSKN